MGSFCCSFASIIYLQSLTMAGSFVYNALALQRISFTSTLHNFVLVITCNSNRMYLSQVGRMPRVHRQTIDNRLSGAHCINWFVYPDSSPWLHTSSTMTESTLLLKCYVLEDDPQYVLDIEIQKTQSIIQLKRMIKGWRRKVASSLTLMPARSRSSR
jgi:hypothetical protein